MGISIISATVQHAGLLSELAAKTFMESHGNSAGMNDLHNYVSKNYNARALESELKNAESLYYIIYFHDQPAGFSKISLNTGYEGEADKAFAKLERFYLLKEYYNLGLGSALFKFISTLCRESRQLGIWLYVWMENHRAIDFYHKKGFVITGSHDFPISATHSNPNHRMLLML